jgi:hypothetical protein
MAIDLGDTPVGTPPTPEQQEQIRASIGIASTDSMTFSALSLAGQSVGGAAATNLVNLATTWDTTGNPSMIYGRVTNTNSGATSNLLDLGTVAAGSLFKIDKTGEVNATGTVISTNDFKVGAARHFHHLGRAAIGSPATGIHTLSNAALNDYDRLQFGGTTSLFPAIKRNGVGLDIKLADDSAFASLGASQLSVSDTWNTNISVLGASGTGTIATITFIAQPAVIPIGATIVVASISPAGYNGTFVVTSSTLTSVSYANATTTSYSSGGTIQRIFTAIKANVTDTASNAGSKLLDLQVGGVSKANVDKAGTLSYAGSLLGTAGSFFYMGGTGRGAITALANGVWLLSNSSGSTTTYLAVDEATNTLALRNLGNTQAFRIYNSASASPSVDYDRASFSFASGNLRIAAENSGTVGYATARGIDFAVSGAVRLSILANGSTNFINEAYFLSPLYSFDGTNSYLGLRSSGGINKLFTTSGSTNKSITISPADVAMMTLTQNGVGIGTTNPVADLDIAETWNAPAISVTGASGNGTTAVITFATQATAIPVGSTVVVAGISPAGYNGTFVVTASNLTSVSYLNATTTTYVSGGTVERLFKSIKLNVTDTASNANSLLMDLQVGGLSKFKVDKTGVVTPINVYSGGAVGYALFNDGGLGLRSAAVIGWTAGNALNAQDTILARDAAGILAQRNGTAKQTLRIYNTYTSASIYERAVMDWNGPTPGNLQIGTEFLGSGSGMAARPIDFVTGGVARWQLSAVGDLLASINNTYDIGASGANKPRNGYFGTSIDTPLITSSAAITLNAAAGAAGITIVCTRFRIGGNTASFPALKNVGTRLQAVLADDTGFTNIQGKLTTDTAFTLGAAAATGYITIYDSNNVAYRVWCTPV